MEPAAAVGISVAAFGFLNQSVRIINQLKERFRNLEKNRELCNELTTCLTRIQNVLKPLKGTPEDLPENVRVYPQETEDDLERLKTRLEKLQKSTDSSSSLKLSRIQVFLKANRWAKELKDLLILCNILYLRTMNLACTKGIVKTVAGASEGAVDKFKPSFYVPTNPESAVLNLEDPSTMEGMLMQKLFHGEATFVAAVSAETGSGVAAVAGGMGGVGKSCSLKGIGRHDKVKGHFTGGIYWMGLGKDATDSTVIALIAEKVEESGGSKLAGQIRDMNNFGEAVRKATSWFSGGRCLFLCDDLWATQARSRGYFSDLRNLVGSESGSRILFSTRDRDIAELAGEGAVHFSPRRTDEARDIICRYANFEPKFLNSCDAEVREAFTFVLERCDGLPLALSIAGRGVASLSKKCKARADAWKLYKNRIQDLYGRSHQLIHKCGDGHDGLFSALLASLECANTQLCEEEVTSGDETSAQRMLEGLCVLEKQGWAPTSMLSRLWSIEDESKAYVIAEELQRLSLIDSEIRYFDGISVLGYKMHDLIHDFCLMQAKKKKEVAFWNATLLDGYLSCKKREEESDSEEKVRNWWSSDVAHDNYIHQNLARHLVECGKLWELEGLLLDFRWTIRQLEVNGLLGLERDFKVCVASMVSIGLSRNEKTDGCEALRMISAAVRLSWPLVERDGLELNGRDLGFQMYSRLFNVGSRMEWVRRYLESIELHVQKPWAKVVSQCHEGPDGRLLDRFYVQRRISALALVPRTEQVVVGCCDGHVQMVDLKTGETVHVFSGHEEAVNSVAISGDGEYIVSGSDDATLRIWKRETGRCVGEPLRGHTGRVISVAISNDFEHIVSGSDDGTLRIWKRETGKCVGEPLRGHTDCVSSVAISNDGEHIVSGSWDGTLRIWKRETGKCVGEPLRGHTKGVSSVAISNDGEHIVSGSVDGTLRIWKRSTGKCVGEPLRGHTHWVSSVAISDDGEHIVSGSGDGTLRIWKRETGKYVGEPLRGHTGWVSSVATSNDGEHIVSGSHDCTLRIWKRETGKFVGEPLRGHTGLVSSVAISNDGEHIVSVSHDNTLRIWKRETGKCVGEALRGHTGEVISVAISNDGEHIVSASYDNTLRIWKRETGKCVGEPLRGHTDGVISVAISNDGEHIVSGSLDRTLRIWKRETGTCVGKPLQGHTGGVRSVAISDDGEHIVSGSNDHTLRIWKRETGTCVGKPLRGHTDVVGSVAISDDREYIVSGSCDGTFRIWEFESGTLTRTVQDPGAWRLDSAGLLIRAFGRAGISGGGGEVEETPVQVIIHAGRKIVLVKYRESQISEVSVLGTFEAEVVKWAFDSERKQVFAILEDGVAALVRVV